MARRRKKSRAAANAKKKDDQSPMLVDKSLLLFHLTPFCRVLFPGSRYT